MRRLLSFAVVIQLAAAARPAFADEASRLSDAAQVIRDVHTRLPADLWSRARCVAVIPDLRKAAFLVGGEYGKGVMSCRIGDRWSAPVFLQLVKGSWGFQAGAEQVDVVLLVMNEDGVQKLLTNNVALGADASIAAGPIGRHGSVGTDAQLTAEILSYSRAQGLFGGIDLSGGILRPDEDANKNAYGANATARTILASREISAPTAASPLLQALNAESELSRESVSAANRPSDRATAAGSEAPTSTIGGDAEIRSRIADMQATIDRILGGAAPAAVGTSGAADSPASASPGTVMVERALLLQLRQQLDALANALNARR